MKKLLPLMLVAIMLLTTLAGCDVLGTLQSLLDPAATETPTEPVITTVTKDEFLAAMEALNYTCDATDGTTAKAFVKSTDTDLHQKITEIPSEQIRFDVYYTTIDGELYGIVRVEDGTYLAGTNDVVMPDRRFGPTFFSAIPGGIFDDFGTLFDSLIYDDASKCYHFESSPLSVSISFENGKVTSASVSYEQEAYNFYDFGTTVIELPEYTLVSDSQ